MPTPVHRILDEQIRLWHQHRRILEQPDRAEPPPSPRPVVTISRQLGTSHGELANGLAERLGLTVHDRTLIEAIAGDRGLEQHVVDALDERTRSEIDLWVGGLLRRRLFSHDEFHVSLARVVRDLAVLGGAVFVGRGANFILADTDCLRVRVVGSPAGRVRTLQGRLDVDRDEAVALMAESDQERGAFIRRLFREDWDSPRNYDLVLNTDHLPAERLVDVTVEAMRVRGLVSAEEDVEARA